jgi:cytochrome b561
MSNACRWSLAVLLVLYLAALVLLAVGSLGLFGSERDPLAAVFLIPLGLPWNGFIDRLPEASHPWLAAAAPLLNILLLAAACRLRRAASAARRGGKPGA